MAEKVFIPIRRGAEIIVFAYIENVAQRRWQFHAIASVEPVSGELTRIGGIRITPDELDECTKLVAALPEVEKAMSGLNPCDAATYSDVLSAGPEAQIVGGSMLFTSTMYLNFIRQYLVEDSAVKRYADRDARERFDVGLSASIYDGMLKRHDLARAEELLDEDLPNAAPPKARHREWAYFYRRAAEIKIRQGRNNSAIGLLEQAAKFWPRPEYQRTMANLSFESDDLPKAISYMKAAHELEPLNHIAALKLATWLKRDGNLEDAREFAKYSGENGSSKAEQFLNDLET